MNSPNQTRLLGFGSDSPLNETSRQLKPPFFKHVSKPFTAYLIQVISKNIWTNLIFDLYFFGDTYFTPRMSVKSHLAESIPPHLVTADVVWQHPSQIQTEQRLPPSKKNNQSWEIRGTRYHEGLHNDGVLEMVYLKYTIWTICNNKG